MLAPLLVAAALLGSGQAGEVISEIVVHGNMIATEAEVLRLAGVRTGMPFEPGTADEVRARLQESDRFERVEVLKRYASIADPSLIVLVIVVDEGRVALDFGYDGEGGGPRVWRRAGPQVMFLPLLDAEDGYGMSYGARLTLPDPAGRGSRLSVPLTWGAHKRASVELERRLDRGPLSRVEVGASIAQRRHPFFREDDTRRRAWVRSERMLSGQWRVGGTIAWESSELVGREMRFVQAGLDTVFDTRIDPMLARNAVYTRAAWHRFAFSSADDVHRFDLEARGYLGLVGQSVLVAGVLHHRADRALPPALKPMLGGMDSVRGWRAGSDIGDRVVAGTAEIRLPLTSPLNLGKIGVSAFFDLGSAYDVGERLSRQRFARGVGGGVWLSAAVLRANIVVARGIGGAARVHVGTGVTF